MREARGWSQAELGRRVGMRQETICLLENPSYGRFTLRTLKRLASAFDVALIVRFAPFGELAAWTTNLSSEDLGRAPLRPEPASYGSSLERCSHSRLGVGGATPDIGS